MQMAANRGRCEPAKQPRPFNFEEIFQDFRIQKIGFPGHLKPCLRIILDK